MSETSKASVVCVIDADDSTREGLSRLLRSAGLDSRAFDSLEAFLREGVPAACALFDLSDLRIREEAFRSRVRLLSETVPLIALTARDDAGTRRVAREVGAQACFRKPVDAAALLDSIEWVTTGRSAGAAS